MKSKKHKPRLDGKPRRDTVDLRIAKRTKPVNDCLVWTGSLVGDYGQIRTATGAPLVHRYLWERKFGPVPTGHSLYANPMCATYCVNPDHWKAHPHMGCGVAKYRTALRKGKS